MASGAGIELLLGDDPGERIPRLTASDGVFAELDVVRLEHVVKARAGGEHALADDELIIDGVAQMPPAARPGVERVGRDRVAGALPALLAASVAASVAASAGALPALFLVVLADEGRRGQLAARRFAENGDHVVIARLAERAARPPQVEERRVDDALLAVPRQVQRHVRAHEIGRLVNERIDVWIHRGLVRRHELPRASRAHLMHVEYDRRE